MLPPPSTALPTATSAAAAAEHAPQRQRADGRRPPADEDLHVPAPPPPGRTSARAANAATRAALTRPGAYAAAHHHVGHAPNGHSHAHAPGHDHGGMTTFILDIDEVVAFTAPRVVQAVARPAIALAQLGAKLVNRTFGPGHVSGAQAARAGATLATGAGIGVVSAAIYYAYTAMTEAYEGWEGAASERRGWQNVLQGTQAPARVNGAAAAGHAQLPLCAALGRSALSNASGEHLLALAEAGSGRNLRNSVGKASATVGAAAMALTLIFSPEFILAAAFPALAPLSPIMMYVAIPTMALYGLVSAFNAALAVAAGAAAVARLDAATKADAQLTAALAPHRSRYLKGLVYEGLAGLGGFSLAVGLFWQVANPFWGLMSLALGTFALEGFTFLRNSSQGTFLPAALMQPRRGELTGRSLNALLRKLEETQRAEAALVARRPARPAKVRGWLLALGGHGNADALRLRLAETFSRLGKDARLFGATHAGSTGTALTAANGSDQERYAAVLNKLTEMELGEAFVARLMEQKGVAKALGAEAADVAAWQRRLRGTQQPLPSEFAAVFYRQALETLWNEGSGAMLTAYAQVRGAAFARLQGGERPNLAVA